MTSVISTNGLILQSIHCTVVTEQTRTEDFTQLLSDDIIAHVVK